MNGQTRTSERDASGVLEINRKSSRKSRLFSGKHWAPAILVASIMATSSAEALSLNDVFSLSASNQSIWSPGSDSFSTGDSVGTSFNNSADFGPGFTGGYGCVLGVCADTTTGLSGNIGASGQAYVGYSAGVTGGYVDVTAANNTTLAISTFSNQFGISVGGGMTGGSTMSYYAPSVQASVNANFALDATVTGTGCLVGACSTVGSNGDLANFSVNKNVVGFDSTQNPPLSIFGLPVGLAAVDQQLPVGGGVSFGFYPPGNQLNAGAFSGTQTIALDAQAQPVFRLGFDPVTALLPEVNPSIDLGPLSASLTTFSSDFGLDLGLDNNLSATVPEMLDLAFSEPVYGMYADGTPIGPTTDVILGINDPNYDGSATLTWVGSSGDLLSRTYETDQAYLDNLSSLLLGGDLNLSAGCYSVDWSIGPVNGNVGGSCLYSHDFSFGSLPIELASNGVPLNFNDYVVNSEVAIALGTPESSTWAMLVLGFLGVGFVAYRRNKIALVIA